MNKLYTIFYPLIWLFMRIFHPWAVSGRENLPEGGVLLCGNHTTLGDPVYVVCAVGPRPQMHVLAKEEVMQVPLLGPLLRKGGMIGIKRGKSDVGAIKECIKVLKGQEPLLIFPEGTRVKEGQSVEAHSGAAMLATRTGVPLLPVYIQPKKRWFRRTRVIFGQPYQPEYEGKRPSPEDYERIAADLMVRIRKLGGEQE